MGELLSVAKACFKDLNWAFQEAKDLPILRGVQEGRSGRLVWYALARQELGQLVFYSVYGRLVPPPHRPAAAELFCRINNELGVGNFEMDFTDGQVRCRTSLDAAGQGLTTPLMRNLAAGNLATMDRYLQVIDAVVDGATPQAALSLRGA